MKELYLYRPYSINLQNLFSPEFDYLKHRLHDGRIVGHFIEDIIVHQLKCEMIRKSGKFYDLIYKENILIECKTLTMDWICQITPSKMIGCDRKINRKEFDKLCSDLIFCIVDIRPKNLIFPVYFIPGYRGMPIKYTVNDLRDIIQNNEEINIDDYEKRRLSERNERHSFRND